MKKRFFPSYVLDKIRSAYKPEQVSILDRNRVSNDNFEMQLFLKASKFLTPM